jgi:integrase/recombinase XerD
MPKLPHVTLLKQVKTNNKWRHARALFDSKGRVRRDRVRINGKDEPHPEGSYFIEWWDHGKRHCIPAGADAQDAADKARVKEAQLTASSPLCLNRRQHHSELRWPLLSTII